MLGVSVPSRVDNGTFHTETLGVGVEPLRALSEVRMVSGAESENIFMTKVVEMSGGEFPKLAFNNFGAGIGMRFVFFFGFATRATDWQFGFVVENGSAVYFFIGKPVDIFRWNFGDGSASECKIYYSLLMAKIGKNYAMPIKKYSQDYVNSVTGVMREFCSQTVIIPEQCAKLPAY